MPHRRLAGARTPFGLILKSIISPETSYPLSAFAYSCLFQSQNLSLTYLNKCLFLIVWYIAHFALKLYYNSECVRYVMHSTIFLHKGICHYIASIITNRNIKNSADADGGPCSRDCAQVTVRSVLHQHKEKLLSHVSGKSFSNISPNPSEVLVPNNTEGYYAPISW